VISNHGEQCKTEIDMNPVYNIGPGTNTVSNHPTMPMYIRNFEPRWATQDDLDRDAKYLFTV